jgi:hypothetical protein
MNDDLLYAQASVDWAVAQFEAFQKRIDTWIGKNVYAGLVDRGPEHADYAIAPIKKELLPLDFSVEAGAYINVIRASLDILAVSLAYRFQMPKAEKASFPIAKSEQTFKSIEFVERLPDIERGLLEELKPYQGGDPLLWPLHQLDIMRKHRRLLEVVIRPKAIAVTGWGLSERFGSGDDKTPFGIPKAIADVHQPKAQLSAYVAINEASLGFRMPVDVALREFASRAKSIIKLFDTP